MLALLLTSFLTTSSPLPAASAAQMTIYGLGALGDNEPPIPLQHLRQVATCLGQSSNELRQIETLLELFRRDHQGLVLRRRVGGVSYLGFVDRTAAQEPRLTLQITGSPALKTSCWL